MQEIGNKGLRLGPWDKAFKFFSSHSAVFLGWKSCCKQEDHKQYVYTYIGRTGKIILILWYSQFQKEAWYKRQIGQHRQSGHSLTGVSKQQSKGIFPPIDVV